MSGEQEAPQVPLISFPSVLILRKEAKLKLLAYKHLEEFRWAAENRALVAYMEKSRNLGEEKVL